MAETYNGHHNTSSSGDSSSYTVSSASTNLSTNRPSLDLSGANTSFTNPLHTNPQCQNIPNTNPLYSNPPYYSPAYSQPPYSNPLCNPMNINAPPPPYSPGSGLKGPTPPYTLPPYQQVPSYPVSGMPGTYNASTSPGFQPSYPQHQQQQQVVVVRGQPVTVVYQPPVYVGRTGAMVLSIFIMSFGIFLCGIIAYILAVMARNATANGRLERAKGLNTASYIVSAVGIASAVVAIIFVFLFKFS